MDEVIWYSIEVRVPCGQQDGHLTVDPKSIKARIAQNDATKTTEEPTAVWDDGTGVLTVTARPGALFREAGSLVLALEGFPVSSKPGPVLLQVTERAANGARVQRNPVTLSLLKQLPKVPRNFRPKASLVAGGKDVVLQWEGPDTLTYQIQGPDGPPVPVQPKKGATTWEWSPQPGAEPKRDATYTLTATAQGQQQPGYFLTTTVHLRSPEFEAVTATAGVRTPWVGGTTDKGRVTFTPQGAQVRDDSDTPGTLSASTVAASTVSAGTVSAVRAEVDVVAAGSVRGRDSDAGWIEFPSDGIRVGHGGGSDLGTVTADKLRVSGINTTWVGDRDGAKGWIEFPQSGVNIRKDGNQNWGTVAADKADLNGINTRWVQGRTADDGWIEFPPAGLHVYQGAGSHRWGTVAADKADLNDLLTHRAQVRERLTLQGGLTVDNVLETQDGPPRLIVHGRLDAESEVLAAGTVTVAGDLTTDGVLRVQGDSLFHGKVNANGHLSVRTGDAWIVHTNDGQVSINGDLRVHGAFRSDS
ncbi:hypothetical protein [Kitasatospora sp. NBC_01300]|uniref:hypothetical protein n=1 Tax=Kitasatospora sp. NBC_01300 TaxID=2903574 RepID=UPI002F91BADF|nr:hypothetical protein OG556_37805 [Kitasatospora sp. NBC_01300]